MASVTFNVGGMSVELSTPPLHAFNGIKQAKDFTHDVAREFVQKQLPKERFQLLCERRPACFLPLGIESLKYWGGDSAKLTLLEPDEIQDLDFGEAFHAESEKARSIYTDPEDDRGKVYPFIVTVRKTERRFIMRPPNSERVVDQFRKANTAEAAKAYCDSHIVWPPRATEEWLDQAPGLFLLVAETSLELAGNAEVRLEGES